MKPAMGAMQRPQTFLYIKVSLSQHSQPSTLNSKHNLRKKTKKKSPQNLKLLTLNYEQQHLFKHLKCILNSKNKRKKIPEDELQLDPKREIFCLLTKEKKISSVSMGGYVLLPTITCQQTMSANCKNIASLIRSLKLMPAQNSTF